MRKRCTPPCKQLFSPVCFYSIWKWPCYIGHQSQSIPWSFLKMGFATWFCLLKSDPGCAHTLLPGQRAGLLTSCALWLLSTCSDWNAFKSKAFTLWWFSWVQWVFLLSCLVCYLHSTVVSLNLYSGPGFESLGWEDPSPQVGHEVSLWSA